MNPSVKLTVIIAGVAVLVTLAMVVFLKTSAPAPASGVTAPGVAVVEPNVPIVNGVPTKDGVPGLGQKDDNLPADPALRSGQ